MMNVDGPTAGRRHPRAVPRRAWTPSWPSSKRSTPTPTTTRSALTLVPQNEAGIHPTFRERPGRNERGHDGGGLASSPDRLRQRGQPVPGPGPGAAPGDGNPPEPGRGTATDRPAASHREPGVQHCWPASPGLGLASVAVRLLVELPAAHRRSVVLLACRWTTACSCSRSWSRWRPACSSASRRRSRRPAGHRHGGEGRQRGKRKPVTGQ